MKVTVEQLPQRQAILSIEAEPEEIEKSRNQAYRHLLQRARVPGFRHGKAPMAMVERFAGKAAFMEEALNHLIPDVTEKALQQQGITVTRAPEIEMVTTEPVVWTAKVDLPPEVDLRAYKDLRLNPEPVIVEPKEVDDALEKLRLNVAPWEPVERPSEMGDLLNIDVNIKEGDRVLAEEKGIQFRPVEGSTAPFPGFSEQLVGLTKGETKDFTLSFADDSEYKEFAGKEYACKVAVGEIKGKKLPALDDEFAKGVGDGFDSLAALRDNIEKEIRTRKERDAKAAFQEKALQAVIDQAQLNYSPGLVEEEAQRMVQEQEDRLRRNRMNMEEYLQALGKSREQVIEEAKPTAQQRVVRSLVATELRNKEQIEVADHEVENEIATLAAGSEKGGESLRQLFQSDAGRRTLRSTILTRKTLERLAEIVTQGNSAAATETKEA